MNTVKSNIQELESKLEQLKALEQKEVAARAAIEVERLAMDESYQQKLLQQQQLDETTQRLIAQVNELKQMDGLHTVAERLNKELTEVQAQIATRHYQIAQLIKQMKYHWIDPTYEATGKVGIELEMIVHDKLSKLLDMRGRELGYYLK